MSKKILFSVIILFVIILTFIVSSYFNTEKNVVQKVEQKKQEFDQSAYEKKPRQYLLSYINSLNKEEIAKQFPIGNIKHSEGFIYAAYYLPNNFESISQKIIENFNHPEAAFNKTRPGVIVFTLEGDKIHIIWESEESLSAVLSLGFVEFKDINNDGIDELILTVGQGVRQTPALWIYQWNGTKFSLINPNPGSTYEPDRWLAGISAELKDVDSDKVFEVVTTNEDGKDMIRRTYKYNGKEYALWKKEIQEATQ